MAPRSERSGHSRVLAVVLALGLCACGTADAPTPKPVLRLAIGAWPGYFPAVIAERQGLMAEEGVRLDITPVKDTSRLIADFAGGRYDLITVSLGNAVTATRARPDVMVLLVANESSGGDKVLKRRGVSLARAEDDPLRVGTTLGGFGEVFLRAWLDRERIDPRQIEWTNVDAPDISSALSTGLIDAGHTWQPYANEAITAGAEVVFSSADTPGLILDTVLVTRETLARHPEAVRGFVRAWFRASDSWMDDPAAGSALASEALGMTPGPVSLEGVFVYRLADNHRVMGGGSDAPLASLIGRYADFFVERGTLSRAPDAEAMFDPAYLPAAEPVKP